MGRGGFPEIWEELGHLLPWRVAARWGKPPRDPEAGRDVLGLLATGRSVLGLTTLVLVAVYTGTQGPGEVLMEEGWEKSSKNVVLALAVVPAAMVALFAVTKSGHRRRFAWWPTVRKLALMVATTLGPMTPIILVATESLPVGVARAVTIALVAGAWLVGVVLLHRYFPTRVLLLAGILLAPFFATAMFLLAILWLVLYIGFVAFWASRTSCWAGLFHPLLAPAVSAFVVVYFTAQALLAGDTKGLPVTLWLWLTLGGLLTTLALATAEHEQLRREGHRWLLGPRAPARDHVAVGTRL